MPSGCATAYGGYHDLYTLSKSRILKVEYIDNDESRRKMLRYDFYIGLYVASNRTIANVALHDLDLHLQGKIFSCYALVIENAKATDGPGRFASTRTAPTVELLLLYFLS